MQNQKSLLSFFQKSQPFQEGQKGNAGDTSLDVTGTDTPPEKVPRRALPVCYSPSFKDSGGSLFSSIQHKFSKVDGKLSTPDSVYVNSEKCLLQANASVSLGKLSSSCIGKVPSKIDAFGPNTPEEKIAESRLKRVREEKLGSIPFKLEGNKRERLLKEPLACSKTPDLSSESSCKFEWLEPSKIRDANRRRPEDPLYDNKTLYIAPDAFKKMSASQKQYWGIKSQYMDVVLFFKVGKFYELYELDAEVGHKELDWKITLSGVGKCRQVGISESGIDDAVEKLVARGYKVGRIEQLETSDQVKSRGGANSVISRKLVQVMTPSTTVGDNNGPDAVHLLAIKEMNNESESGKTTYGFSFVDCSSLQFWVGSVADDSTCSALGALLIQISPREVIYEKSGLSKESIKALRKYSHNGSSAAQLTPLQRATFVEDADSVKNLIQNKNYFSKSSASWTDAVDGSTNPDASLVALGALIDHLSRLMLEDCLHNGNIFPYHVYTGCLRMDGQTLVNLEIFTNNADAGLSGTLIKYLDKCCTPCGKRLLRRWICHPLKHVDSINNRLNVVEVFVATPDITSHIELQLRKLPDLERLLGRLKSTNRSSPSLLVPFIGKKIARQRVKAFGFLVKGLRVSLNLLVGLSKEETLSKLLSKVLTLPNVHDLSNLASHLDAKIDAEFPNYELADTRGETIDALLDTFMEKCSEWCEVIHATSVIDVLRCFAFMTTMSCSAMCKPVVLRASSAERGAVLELKGLWHPFALGESNAPPVPNDVVLTSPSSMLLTGPNMGGKSTLLRATCLAVIMAQLGCYVPSETCVLSLVDVIFTRLGATDRIMSGESTFLVECSETASILRNATEDSLVILDELGRGTSTFDGYAIAYSVFRHLVEKTKCRMLFATHYHPLTKEFGSHPRVTMQHMACSLTEERRVVFLYKLMKGACPESYGLQVAEIAGLPADLIRAASRAGALLKKSIRKCFNNSEGRSHFSTLHEHWFRGLLSLANAADHILTDDSFDDLFCFWHEIRTAYPSPSSYYSRF